MGSGVPRFYTLPPPEIPYPYIIINANRPGEGLSYLERNGDAVYAVIVDSGVEVFRKPGVREYPRGARDQVDYVAKLWREVKELVPEAEVYAVIPDYPDDYRPRSLWEGEGRTNIERTLDNVEYALEAHPEVDWIIPLQGHYEEPESLLIALEELEAIGALDWAAKRTRYLAIANLCTSKRCKTIEESVKLVHEWLEGRGYSGFKLHAFGVSVRCVPRVSSLLFSWDSLAWTRARVSGCPSARGRVERVYYFLSFLVWYAGLLDLPPVPRAALSRCRGRRG